jgi:hypothetical protein
LENSLKIIRVLFIPFQFVIHSFHPIEKRHILTILF